MKQFFYIMSILLLLSCSTEEKKSEEASQQERAEALMESYTKGLLYVPESYEPIETKIDSAFTSIYNDIEIYNAASKILKYQNEHRYSLLYDLSERDSKMLLSNIDIIKSRAQQISREFCGWQIYHRCRVKDIKGTPDFVQLLCFTDKEISKVLLAYNLDENSESNYDAIVEVIDCAIDGEYDTKYQYTEPYYYKLKGYRGQTNDTSERVALIEEFEDIKPIDDAAADILNALEDQEEWLRTLQKSYDNLDNIDELRQERDELLKELEAEYAKRIEDDYYYYIDDDKNVYDDEIELNINLDDYSDLNLL
jgi:flagellar motility protein MotE (MotC chaperone)